MTLRKALEESGLLADFIDICTPDITNKQALQWCQRRTQLQERVKCWPVPNKMSGIRKSLNCSPKRTGSRRKLTKDRFLVVRKKPSTRPKSTRAAMVAGCGFQTPRRQPLEWEGPCNE